MVILLAMTPERRLRQILARNLMVFVLVWLKAALINSILGHILRSEFDAGQVADVESKREFRLEILLVTSASNPAGVWDRIEFPERCATEVAQLITAQVNSD